ncbi:MAG: hypothetical protein ABIP21_04485 [Acidimicrobiia bacterium]
MLRSAGRPGDHGLMHRARRIVAIAACGIALAACSSSTASSGKSGTDSGTGPTAASRALTTRTKAAGVELLDQESFETHIHTQLVVKVNGTTMEVPDEIGIDQDANRIAALHTHDTDGLIHVESPVKNAKYTLDQFLILWGMPADADGRCTFFKAAAPCTLAVASKSLGPVGLDVTLVDEDTLTLTVTST